MEVQLGTDLAADRRINQTILYSALNYPTVAINIILSVFAEITFPLHRHDGEQRAVRDPGTDRDGTLFLGHRLQPPHRHHAQTRGKKEWKRKRKYVQNNTPKFSFA
jgi:hypothetical protein